MPEMVQSAKGSGRRQLAIYFARAVDLRSRRAVRQDVLLVRAELRGTRIRIVDPLADQSDTAAADEIVSRDLALLRRADAVLMDLSIDGWPYIGCVCELVYAHLWAIPAFVFVGETPNATRPWLVYHSNAVLRTRREAIHAMLSHFDIPAPDRRDG